ncbi:MAG: hypothetical protein RIT14_1862 [Pseudomonadota bacterium]|jgi:hypothetical protein
MQDIAELERRITAALQRIGDGLESLRAPASDGAGAEDLARLRAELQAERAISAGLRAELAGSPSHAAQLDRMTHQLDVQGLELNRLRKTVAQLRDSLRQLREAAASQIDAELINRTMAAELDALRTIRLSEVAELDEILSELDPLIAEVRQDA